LFDRKTGRRVKRAIVAEAIGTALLVATVIGSGIMAERLANGNDAVALLGNTAATGAMLYVLINLLGPISGAQFNPLVTVLFSTGRSRWAIIAAQILAAVAGAMLAHAMFGHALIEAGRNVRSGPSTLLGEAVATFGLLMTIRLGLRFRADAVPALVAAWIVAGYWFTSSTSFANPAVTIARALTDSFSGIRMVDVPGFIVAQIIGGIAGYWVSGWLITEEEAQ
jgi:glycerol uptake facilitator-like aquaporin